MSGLCPLCHRGQGTQAPRGGRIPEISFPLWVALPFSYHLTLLTGPQQDAGMIPIEIPADSVPNGAWAPGGQCRVCVLSQPSQSQPWPAYWLPACETGRALGPPKGS